MKLLLFLLFPLSAMSQYGVAYEPINWVGSERTAPPDTFYFQNLPIGQGIDTVYAMPYNAGQKGEIICDTIYGRIVYANEYRVVLEKGYRVERTGKESLQVDYRTWMGEAILPKNVIKFIENEK